MIKISDNHKELMMKIFECGEDSVNKYCEERSILSILKEDIYSPLDIDNYKRITDNIKNNFIKFDKFNPDDFIFTLSLIGWAFYEIGCIDEEEFMLLRRDMLRIIYGI